MIYCYPKSTNTMSPIHLKNGLNHTLVIEQSAAALMAHCLMHWCWPEEFRKGQFWAQYHSRCTSTTFQLESPTQMSTYMQMTLPYGRLTVTRCLFSVVFKTAFTELVDGYLWMRWFRTRKRLKHLIIGTVQKLLHSGNPSLDLSLCGTPIEVAKTAFRR